MSETIAAENVQTGNGTASRDEANPTTGTFVAPFDQIEQFLTDKPLRRPNRTHPAPRQLSNEKLKQIAKSNPPPPEWFEGEEECPF